MDGSHNFSHRKDLHQAPGYQRLMRSIGWESVDAGGSIVFLRQLGPIAFAKMQRPSVVDLPQLIAVRRTKRIVQLRIEPAIHVELTTVDGRRLKLDLSKKEDLLEFILELRKAKWNETRNHFAHTKTAVFSLTTTEAFLAGLPQKTRYNIKTAYRRELQFTVLPGDSVGPTDYSEFDLIHTRWGKERGIKAFDTQFVWSALQSFGSEAFLIRVHDDNQPLGALIILMYEGVGYYYYACTTNAGLRLHAAEGLVFEAINVCCERGCEWFDFWSVWDERYPHDNPKWKGFSEFKSRFHPIDVVYPPSFVRGIL